VQNTSITFPWKVLHLGGPVGLIGGTKHLSMRMLCDSSKTQTKTKTSNDDNAARKRQPEQVSHHHIGLKFRNIHAYWAAQQTAVRHVHRPAGNFCWFVLRVLKIHMRMRTYIHIHVPTYTFSTDGRCIFTLYIYVHSECTRTHTHCTYVYTKPCTLHVSHVIIGVIRTADFRESHCAPDAGIYVSGIVGLAQIVALT
jgi:hypothetical protein